MKVLILGGGASGLMAALSAAQDERNTVTVLERQSRVGRKLLATGNGRCNLTNLDLSPVHYHGQDAGFARAALSRFDGTATLDFFHALGLLTTAEPSGRVYPLSDQSNSVVDVLRFAAAQAGVQLVCGFDAQSVKKKARGYQVAGADGSAYFGDKLIIACGGCAGKALGGTMSGYELLSQLGHSRTALHPSLTQIRTDPAPIRGLKGVRADCRIRLRADGRTLLEDAGEVQFTETGVSGPAAFTLSRAAGQAQGAGLLLDFCGTIPRRRCARFCRHGAKRSRRWRARSCFPVCSIRVSARRSAMPAASARSRLRPVPTRRWKRWYLLSNLFLFPSRAFPASRAHR